MKALTEKDKINTAGIYGILNLVNGKIYIGKTGHIPIRMNKHFNCLENNKHPNLHLQNSYNKYGKDAFSFVVLEICYDVHERTVREQVWVDYYKQNIYNKILDVKSHDGYSFLDKNHTENTKIKMSVAKKGKYIGENNPNFGKKANFITIRKMVNRNSGAKLLEDDVLQIKQLILEDILSHQEIADKFNIARSVVTRIANGQRWSHITGGVIYPGGIRNRLGGNLSEKHKARIGASHKGMKYKTKSEEN